MSSHSHNEPPISPQMMPQSGQFTQIKLVQGPNGQLQVTGLLPGQQLVQLPDGQLQLSMMTTGQNLHQALDQTNISTPSKPTIMVVNKVVPIRPQITPKTTSITVIAAPPVVSTIQTTPRSDLMATIPYTQNPSQDIQVKIVSRKQLQRQKPQKTSVRSRSTSSSLNTQTVTQITENDNSERQISLDTCERLSTPAAKANDCNVDNIKWDENKDLICQLKELNTSNYTDSEICVVMRKRFPHYKWSLSTLKRRRKALNLKRWDKNLPRNELMDALKEEIAGPGRTLGYRALYRKMREKHKLLVTRQEVYNGMKVLCPLKLEERRLACHKEKTKKPADKRKGSNLIWNYEVSEKLSGNNHEFPFGIHGAIDCFSSRVLWMKVWPTNTCADLPGKLFLDAVEALGVYPDFTKSEEGTEAVSIATMQTYLAQSGDAHIYGSSTTNHVLQKWYRGFIDVRGASFKRELMEIKHDGLYNAEESTCRVLLAFVFMDLIQKSLDDFVVYWNTHRIRTKKFQQPCGIVNYLYECPEANGGEQCGLKPDPERLDSLKAQVAELQDLNYLEKDTQSLFENFLETRNLLPITLKNAGLCYKELYSGFGHYNYDFIYS